jgi:hypothetical protein
MSPKKMRSEEWVSPPPDLRFSTIADRRARSEKKVAFAIGVVIQKNLN